MLSVSVDAQSGDLLSRVLSWWDTLGRKPNDPVEHSGVPLSAKYLFVLGWRCPLGTASLGRNSLISQSSFSWPGFPTNKVTNKTKCSQIRPFASDMGGKPDCDDGSMSEIIQSWQSASVGTSTRNSAGLLATNEPIARVYSVEKPTRPA